MDDPEEPIERIDMKQDEMFGGLIGDDVIGKQAHEFLRNKIGGTAGEFIGKAAEDFIDKRLAGGGMP